MTSVCPIATKPSTLMPVRMSRMLPALKKLRPTDRHEHRADHDHGDERDAHDEAGVEAAAAAAAAGVAMVLVITPPPRPRRAWPAGPTPTGRRRRAGSVVAVVGGAGSRPP